MRCRWRGLLSLKEPPRYERAPASWQLDPFKPQIAAMLAEDPKVAATVIMERLRAGGLRGVGDDREDHLRQVRQQFVAAHSFQRTSYLPGELCRRRLKTDPVSPSES